MREEEIKAYKKKTVDERLLADSVDVADRQPLFLKDKGDALYKQGNYRWAGCRLAHGSPTGDVKTRGAHVVLRALSGACLVRKLFVFGRVSACIDRIQVRV